MDMINRMQDGPADEIDTAEDAAPAGARSRVDVMQLLFWGCLLISIAAASVALAWPKASGAPGPILLIAMGSGGLVFLLWTVRGAGRIVLDKDVGGGGKLERGQGEAAMIGGPELMKMHMAINGMKLSWNGRQPDITWSDSAKALMARVQ